MSPNQTACLNAMEIPRWVLRDAPVPEQYTLISGAGQAWQAIAPTVDVESSDQQTLRLLANILKAIGLRISGAEFFVVTSSPPATEAPSLAFLGDRSLDGWTQLPTLSEMLTKPRRKRDAWEILQRIGIDGRR